MGEHPRLQPRTHDVSQRYNYFWTCLFLIEIHVRNRCLLQAPLLITKPITIALLLDQVRKRSDPNPKPIYSITSPYLRALRCVRFG